MKKNFSWKENVRIKHTLREGNKDTDFMSNWGLNFQNYRHNFDFIFPEDLKMVVLNDQRNT